MSSPKTATAADDSVAVADKVEKPQRRFPPPCWTQDETLALIEAYRERWYALRRGYLRTADWDAVATTVAERCPGASPAKTSAQCRHKMEKLRQRFRAEKQRALSLPHPGGRYFSSWFFFENMEAMENGTSPPSTVHKPENSADGTRLKSLLDQNI
ncbi:Alcohol dehydrogenase transcription factor Myb/SANT-like family protein, partial [Perilla frutescens var. frutescens]